MGLVSPPLFRKYYTADNETYDRDEDFDTTVYHASYIARPRVVMLLTSGAQTSQDIQLKLPHQSPTGPPSPHSVMSGEDARHHPWISVIAFRVTSISSSAAVRHTPPL